MTDEKRNSIPESAQLELDLAANTGVSALRDRVGGRMTAPRRLPGGGGYQDICTGLKFGAEPRDPRLAELAAMRLPPFWLELADLLGAEVFLALWRLVDASPYVQAKGSMLQLPEMRPYRSYLRFQRNAWLAELAEHGCSTTEIRRRAREQMHWPIEDVTYLRQLIERHATARQTFSPRDAA
ncbi:hypothetical protein [Paraburkholderia adhaesiva]|uniref:hypothetical protein n=1 Tax=Paraburkholderia adhaesiva TaxID=2883244 RepID=UPI001F1F71CF|nr:hypothetical protein [Paraburkholderia adhaesiva]